MTTEICCGISNMVFVYRTTLAIPAGADPAAAAARQSLSEAITRGGDLAGAAQDAFVRGYVGVLIVSMVIMAVCAVAARTLFGSLATMGEEAEADAPLESSRQSILGRP
jgi:hypothetical protein